jgi:hypothetical protein
MESSKILFYSSKFPRARERISSKFTDNLDMRPPKNVRQPCPSHLNTITDILAICSF